MDPNSKRNTPAAIARRKSTQAAYRATRREEAKARTRAWLAANPERAAEWRKQYRAANKDKINAHIRNRRAVKRAAPGRHTAADVRTIGARQKWCCAWCGVPCKARYHVDHIVPLVKGGTNGPENICIACPDCNLRKQARHPDAFAQSMGKLL